MQHAGGFQGEDVVLCRRIFSVKETELDAMSLHCFTSVSPVFFEEDHGVIW